MTTTPFWKSKTLAELSPNEWESLCDGCGLCCLHKLEDADTGEIRYTNVACRLLDCDNCRCRHYGQRFDLVPDCVGLAPDRLENLRWMPATCAYRLVAEGKPLAAWHPLVSGSPTTVHSAGISIRGRVVSEEFVDEDSFEEQVVDWVRPGD